MIEENMNIKNNHLSKYACKDSEAIYLADMPQDYRTPFFRDIDRIIYSLAYARYMDKTQVFSFIKHDHLCKRIHHVQFVSKIGRTIGRALGLNEDLIEAAALGHDLGHAPFGHFGETILDEISRANGEGSFNHNIHSARLLLYIENFGNGLNITLQTLDAIMCHNGEFALGEYAPRKKTKTEFFDEYKKSYKNNENLKALKPMTLEGCVVRISDIIAYLGRDIEDGIRMKLIERSDIPEHIVKVLGNSTTELVNTIVTDIIKNSIGRNYIKLSEPVYKAIVDLKQFNYEHICLNAYSEEEKEKIELMINTLFKKYMHDLETKNEQSNIIKSYLKNLNPKYWQNNTNARLVLDYIAGMTDDFCVREYNNYINELNTRKEE